MPLDEQAPDFIDPELKAYLERMFLEADIQDNNKDQLNRYDEIPNKLSIGKQYYFNAAIATTPITSAGLWIFNESGWSPGIPPIENWHEVGGIDEPPFLNNWINFNNVIAYNTCAFYLDPFGIVHLKGLLENGVSGSAPSSIFLLPLKYRPSHIGMYNVIGDGTTARIDISNSGDIAIVSGSGAGFLSLDGITFRV